MAHSVYYLNLPPGRHGIPWEKFDIALKEIIIN